MSNENLRIWRRVEKTDPQYTKGFNRGGGFRGTSTNATYLAMKATEVFGPLGIGWGVEIVDEEMMEGAPLDEQGTRETIHKLCVKLWYMLGEKRGEVVQYGQTTFIGKNKYGLFTDEEAPKKSLTDGMSKCLSLLGFSADIHLGRYDDNKYVADLKREFQEKESAEKQAEKTAAGIKHVLERVKKADAAGLQKAQEWVKTNIKDEAALQQVLEAIEARQAQLKKEGAKAVGKTKAKA